MNKLSGWKIAGLVFLILVIAVGLIVLGLAMYVDSALSKINRVQEIETLSQEEIEAILSETDPPEESALYETETAAHEETVDDIPELTECAEDETKPLESGEATVVNILLIGQDRRGGTARQRSDAMILCTINSETKTMVLTSFLRDTYVQLPDGYGKNRLNVPYVIGGFEMLDECLEQNFGVHVDYNIEVDFDGFIQIIDILGGVDMEVTAAEIRHMVGVPGAGVQHLNGEQALAYARIRKIDNDFGRTNRQRKLLTAIYEQAKDLSIREILELTEVIFPMLTTDMTDTQIIRYISKLFPIWDELEIITQSVPGDGEYEFQRINGMSVVVPYLNKIRQKLENTIGS